MGKRFRGAHGFNHMWFVINYGLNKGLNLSEGINGVGPWVKKRDFLNITEGW